MSQHDDAVTLRQMLNHAEEIRDPAAISAVAATLVIVADVEPWHLLAISAASAAVGGILVLLRL